MTLAAPSYAEAYGDWMRDPDGAILDRRSPRASPGPNSGEKDLRPDPWGAFGQWFMPAENSTPATTASTATSKPAEATSPP